MQNKMKKYKIYTDFGIFYRMASNKQAALQRIVYAIYGKNYKGFRHEYWIVEEI